MALNIDAISPKARAEYIRVGRWWGSKDTLAQANDTLRAIDMHGAAIAAFGFSIEDGKRLALARDALQDAGVGRTIAEATKKVTSRAYLDAMREAKNARLSARSVLANVERVLREQEGADAESALRELGSVLAKTQSAGADDEALARQLELLAEAFRRPLIGREAETRGGTLSLRELEAAIHTLRESAQARVTKPGTPSETEQLDLLDGIIVSLARAARRAARLAAVRLGSPALAKAFELSRLYATRTKPTNEAAPEAPTPPPPSSPPPAPACG